MKSCFIEDHILSNDVNQNLSLNSTAFSHLRCVDKLEIRGALNKEKSGSVGIDGIPINFGKRVFPLISKFFRLQERVSTNLNMRSDKGIVLLHCSSALCIVPGLIVILIGKAF